MIHIAMIDNLAKRAIGETHQLGETPKPASLAKLVNSTPAKPALPRGRSDICCHTTPLSHERLSTPARSGH
jgi:hypothetical protein